MANGINRIFKVIQNTNENTISELVNIKVRTLNPLTFQIDDKLILTEDFIVMNNTVDKSKLSVGDVFNAFTFNDSQVYYINQAVSTENEVTKSNPELTNLANLVTSLQEEINNLKTRVKTLEDKEV